MIKLNDKAFQTDNWAELLSEDERNRLVADLMSDIQLDQQSMSESLKDNQKWIDLAMQVKEEKSWPWTNSSNVKFPLLTTACMQFHSRAQQALLKGKKPIKGKVLGKDPDGSKTARAERLEEFMGFELLDRMECWEDDVDRMLMVLPIVGTAYKKIYFSATRNYPKDELVLPSELILNYHATDFNRARRTHMMTKYHNEVVELMRAGVFLSVSLVKDSSDSDVDESEPSRARDERLIYEAHCYLDLDGDGYEEPYIVTIDSESQQLLRLSPRFHKEGVILNEDGDIAKIEAIEFFSRFIFLPSAESKLYGVGLGSLLGPTNMAVNTLINQLIDAGSLAVLPSGFLGRGARLNRSGALRFGPGEWKTLTSTGDDLRKAVYPLPVKEPSNVLFQLLGTLIESGKQIGSVADIMLGESPGQNQPYSTTMAVLEQGMKVFVGIYKRVYRSMADEYRKLIEIVMMYEQATYKQFFGDEFDVRMDFSPRDLALVPVSDPDMVSETLKLMRAESLTQKMAAGFPLNQQEVMKRVLEAEGHENIDLLLDVPPPQPDQDYMFKMAELQATIQLEYDKMQMEMPAQQAEMFKDIAQAMVNLAKAKSVEHSDKLRENKEAADTYLARRKQDIDAQGQTVDLAKAAIAAKAKEKNASKPNGSSS